MPSYKLSEIRSANLKTKIFKDIANKSFRLKESTVCLAINWKTNSAYN